MKKQILFFMIIFIVEMVSFFMGVGYVLVMYRVFGPYVRWMWVIGVGWILLFSFVSVFPLRDLLSRIKE